MLVFALVALVCALIYYIRHHYEYWKRQGVPYIKATFPIGNLTGILSMRSSPAEEIGRLYRDKSGRGQAFVGIHVFNKPGLLLRDPQLIKRILVRDFGTFCNRYAHADCKSDPLGTQNVFFLRDGVWKEVRLKLSPFFTSSRLKNMLPLIETVAGNLDVYLKEKIKQNSLGLEMKELCAQFTTDVISTVAFGVEANSFEQPNSDFRCSGRNVFEFNFKRALGFVCVFFLPKLVPLINFEIVPQKATLFFRNLFNSVIAEREKTGQQRNDLIDILIKHRKLSTTQENSRPSQLVFDGDFMLAQATIFFTAGFESSSSTMAFALHALAKHADVQKKVREEISAVLQQNDGQVTQRVVDSLEYMQMVIQEVLRLYPPLPFLDRQCTLPGNSNGYSLAPYSHFKVPHGMPVYIPVYGLQTDAKYFPDPFKFDPERFSAQNKRTIDPYTYMPFGAGPHGCIGERFAMLQTKVGLLHILRGYRAEFCDKTEMNIKLNPKALIMQANNGIYLNFVRDSLNVDKNL